MFLHGYWKQLQKYLLGKMLVFRIISLNNAANFYSTIYVCNFSKHVCVGIMVALLVPCKFVRFMAQF
jgi:hypothetical protein